MKNLCNTGFKINGSDKKALEHFLLETPKQWAQSALNGMINKAVKTIINDYFELYKSKQTGNISADYAIVIPAIIAMEEFKPYKVETPAIPKVSRDQTVNEEIWEGGFDVEDYKEAALKAYYDNPEEMLWYFMENKVYQRRKAFVKEKEKEYFERKEDMPAKEDDFINHACAKAEYKNRSQIET